MNATGRYITSLLNLQKLSGKKVWRKRIKQAQKLYLDITFFDDKEEHYLRLGNK